ncbi:MAG: DUF3459 domain-containing protein [Lachnospiraceae bacterium]|nr:DUF3459 domain-containing protein [Lachnospiraceae bacterium]
MPSWLKDAVFYEIYPQSFYDSDGDGIGDIPGIIEKLPAVAELGCTALWINPCFDSPFKDAGYDVRDYYKVAARYGTNEDLYRLFETAHGMGIRVLLDLVPGHTSEEHPWFRESRKAEANAFSDRYIWTDFWLKGIAGRPYIGGESPRNGTYMLNFFKCQPALNYGWYAPEESWQKAMDDPACLATREAIKDVMRFWMDRGCDGFRVDMADSLVKNDTPEKTGTSMVWRDVREMMDREYPECALVSEWGNPVQALKAGFHMDFYLDHGGNGYNTLLRDYETGGPDRSYFRCGAGGRIQRFLQDYLPRYEASKDYGYISFITCNHDTPRARRTLGERELKLAYACLLTLPGVPFIYYGDEIGMRYLEDLPSKEGGYTRTGSRTPMQWGSGPLYGFSAGTRAMCPPEAACADDAAPGVRPYLPVDPAPDAPTLEAQKADPASLYNAVKDVIALRHRFPDLQADGDFSVLSAADGQDTFVYRRGGLVLAVNPGPAEETVPGIRVSEPLFVIGKAAASDGGILAGPQSFAVFRAG